MMKRPEVERKAAVGWGSYDDVAGDAQEGARRWPLSARRDVQRRRRLYRLGDPLGDDVRRPRPQGREGVRRLCRAPFRPAGRRSAPRRADSRPMPSSGTNRRLATILFADVDGYSRLMRADEEQTLDDLRAHLAELVAPVVERFHGRIVKTVGDGVMVEFGSAVEAVRSAVELQRGMVERNAGMPAERRQAFRIGLHLGDIIVSDEDVFGDTVNVAARLQGLAEPGSIVLSASVYEQVRDKLALPFRVSGSRTLKNIDRPIRAYALDAAALSETGAGGGQAGAAAAADGGGGRGSPWRSRSSRAASPPTSPAAACRPRKRPRRAAGSRPKAAFRSPSCCSPTRAAMPTQDYFSDGLTEDITRALGRFKELTVIAYGAVLPFRNKELPPTEIGRALNARYLVSGSVRRMGQRVRVTVQLSDAANGTQLWSEQYDDELSDIFAVQERIARRVAGTLASSLQQIALQQSLRKPTDNLDAYDLLLRARALAADPTRLGNRIGARAARAGDAAGAGLRRRLCRARRHLFPARRLRLVGVRPDRRRDGDPARAEGDRARRGMRAGAQRPGARLHGDAEVRYRPRRIGAGAADQSQRRRGPARRGRRCCCGPAASTNRSRPPKRPCASTSISAPRPRSISASPTCWAPLRRRRAAARSGARALSGLSAARLPAGRRLRRARPNGRRAGCRPSRASARIRISTWRASARASRTRRCSAGSRKACARPA